MKRLTTIIILLTALHITGWAMERGIPFFKNITAAEYNAHNHNYDVACDEYGTVFVANFEGLLYFDGATWRNIHTPGISRVTCIARGTNGKVWIGGYNVFGYLYAGPNGELHIKPLISDATNHGDIEFKFIKVAGNEVYAITTRGQVYHVKDGKRLEVVKRGGLNIFNQAKDSVTSLLLPDGVRVSYNSSSGLKFGLPDNSAAYISEADGLISNDISYVTYDKLHTLWGATEKGIFCTEVTTPYSHVTDKEGLKGAVNVVNELGNTVYIGTTKGLFTLKDGHITKIKGIDLSCWDLADDGKGNLIAPTSQGLYIISKGGIRKLTNNHSLSAYIDKKTGYYTIGEIDGVYRISPTGQRTRIAPLTKVTYMMPSDNRLLVLNIYGALWQIPIDQNSKAVVKCLRKKIDPNTPKIYYKDSKGRLWKTDAFGNNLQVQGNNVSKSLSTWISPLRNKTLTTIHVCNDGNIIVGGEFGIIVVDAKAISNLIIGKPEKLYIRQVKAMGKSIIWGGYTQGTLKPITNLDGIELPFSCHDVMVTFSTRTSSLIIATQYRYRVDDGQWSAWSDVPYADFNNLRWGKTKLEIQSRDLFGHISETSSVTWYIEFPWYMRWWAMLFYLIILIYIIAIFFRWRERRLEHEKQKLEGIVAKRTSELSAAYDEQQKISSELSNTLDDLKRTQDDLVRMERTATAGKLTQGLIDRILNPINYINNFSKLTSGLAKDLTEDIEDEKENMSEDNYEDCEDILSMMNQNLSKIEEHGVNTTRTLRAMEAMLNNHIGALVNQNICPLCRQVADVVKDHFKEDVAHCNISIKAELPDQPVMADIDADAINRILLSLMSNSVYAITKKYSQTPYNDAKIVISAKAEDGHAIIKIQDNGIGIEDTIKEKVFDPFFTTKPTGEAAGVGLYLVRETINDHHGTITLDSVKGEYCEFTITL